MAPEWDQNLHVLRDTDYLVLKDISITSPPIGGNFLPPHIATKGTFSYNVFNCLV